MNNSMKNEGQEVILIDGSHGEGGGQIIRNAVTYACLLRKKIEVTNIRAGRPNPGLSSQHLESILALLQISGATTSSNLKKGSTELNINGVTIAKSADGVTTTIDLKTAGSVMLCVQCILPYLMTLRTPSKVRILGGTHVLKAPNYDYMTRVFLPIMNKFLGYDVDVKMLNPGYFPRGGGRIELMVNPLNNGKYNPVQLTDRGSLLETHAILNLTPKLMHFVEKFKQQIYPDTRSIEVRTVSYASVEYFLRFENGFAGFYYLAEGRNPISDEVFVGISKVKTDLKVFMKSSACVDSFMQDQLIIYMTLAKLSDMSQSSHVRSVTPTDHTLSAIHVSQLFTSNLFSCKKEIEMNDEDETFSITL